MDKNTIFITGAASGIGRATAERFAAAGWFVGLYDIDEAGLASLAQNLGEDACTTRCLDLRDRASIQGAVEDFSVRTGGRMDVLFNCAGVMTVGPHETITSEAVDAMLMVNNGGLVHCTQAAFSMLKGTDGARVISVCSASALYGVPDFAVYSGTKFFVRGWTEALNLEWRRYGIHVCDVLPPFVNTPLLTKMEGRPRSMVRMGVHLEASDVAAVVWRAAVGRKRIHWPVHWQFKILYAISGWLPRSLQKWVMSVVSGY